MKINNELNMRCIAFSVLKALLPSLNDIREDISETRIAHPKSSYLQGIDPNDRFTSVIVRLQTPELVQKIMTARKSFKKNYFSTKNLNLSLLNSEIISALPDSRIFVNEVLSTPDRLHYESIKETAINLGFKYVWHSTGKILVRWNAKTRSHLIRSISDLTTITDSLGAVSFNTQMTLSTLNITPSVSKSHSS